MKTTKQIIDEVRKNIFICASNGELHLARYIELALQIQRDEFLKWIKTNILFPIEGSGDGDKTREKYAHYYRIKVNELIREKQENK